MDLIDQKVMQLIELGSGFLVIEDYSHSRVEMYKIINIYTHLAHDKIVLCPVSDGISHALDLAITAISGARIIF